MSDKKGFTLIELSIVLVIIGLVVGGVLVGRDLIYSARIKKVISELQQFQTAVNTFRGKYDCLPGDCPNITTYLGTDAGGCPAGGGASGVCNGNGNGIIAVCSNPNETTYVWRHLAMSNLIPARKYSGRNTCTGTLVLDSDIPSSSYSPNIGYHMGYPDVSVGYPSSISMWAAGVQIGAVAVPAYSGDQLWGAGLLAPDAAALDKKMDDGIPGGGALRSVDSYYPSPSNSNTTCLSGSSYASSSATGCSVYWKLL